MIHFAIGVGISGSLNDQSIGLDFFSPSGSTTWYLTNTHGYYSRGTGIVEWDNAAVVGTIDNDKASGYADNTYYGLDNLNNLYVKFTRNGNNQLDVYIKSTSGTCYYNSWSLIGKIYKSGTSGTAVSKFTTGWFNNGSGNTLTNGQNYTFSHSLGTDDLLIELWQRDLSGGTNLQKVEVRDGQSGGGLWGATITALTTSTITVQLAISGTLQMLSNGNGSSAINWNTQQFKLVVAG